MRHWGDMPDVLLIQPPIEDFYLTAKRTLPYGLACIAASLRQAGFSVAIVDGLATAKSRRLPVPEELNYLAPYFERPDQSPFALFHQFRHFGYSYQYLAECAKASGAFLIGISSLFTAYRECALNTADAIKQQCPDTVIVMGGHDPTALPYEVVAHPAVDYVLRGDGEIGMPMLAKALKQKSRLDHIPGLIKPGDEPGKGKLPQPAVVENLDTMPMPAMDLIQWRYYQRKGAGSLTISAGRGCPQRCTYCAVNAATYHGFRQKTVGYVMRELETAEAQMPMGFIDFEDEHLSADKPWFIDLLQAIRQRYAPIPLPQKPELRAMNGLFAPSLDEEIITHMKAAGFQTLNLALITTNRDQLKRFNRPCVNNDMDRVPALAHRHQLGAVAYIIVAGPHQDPMSSISDLIFLAQRPVLAGVSTFYPAPGSPDYQWCRRHGLLPQHPGLLRATAIPLAHMTNRDQTITLLRLGRMLNFMKSLMDQGGSLPPPMKLNLAEAPQVQDRDHLGRLLLSAFFNDGTVFGRDQDGTIYPHQVDQVLVKAFLDGIKKVGVRGTRSL